MKKEDTSGSSQKPLRPKVGQMEAEKDEGLIQKPSGESYEEGLLGEAVSFLAEKGWTRLEALEQLELGPDFVDKRGLNLIFEKYGVTWRKLGYSPSQLVEIITEIWLYGSERQALLRLYEIAADFNEQFFYGVLTNAWLTIILPFRSGVISARALHMTAEEKKMNMTGYHCIWLQPDLMPRKDEDYQEEEEEDDDDDNFTEEDFRPSADCLLHEMAHLMVQWIAVEGRGSKRYYGKTAKYWRKVLKEWWKTYNQYLNADTFDHFGHNPVFTAIVNHIGAQMGLPAVRTATANEFKKAKPVERIKKWSGAWPQKVRPKGYYPPHYYEMFVD